MVWDAPAGRLIANAGSNIVVIDPDAAQIVDTIASGVQGQSLAVSDDGQYLYVSIGSRAVIDRYQIHSHIMDLEISLGVDSQGHNLTAGTMVVLPGQPHSILVARSAWSSIADDLYLSSGVDLAVYDDATPRPATAQVGVESLYIRPSDGSFNAWAPGFVYVLGVNPSGVSIARTTPITPLFGRPVWNGGLGVDSNGWAYDLDFAEIRGSAAFLTGTGCGLMPGPSGGSILTAEGSAGYNSTVPQTLGQYSKDTFVPLATASISGAPDFATACDQVSEVRAWGSDGVAIAAFQNDGGGSNLVLFHAAGLTPYSPPTPAAPTTDAAGIVHIPLPANGLLFDSSRNLLWATIPGKGGQYGNSVISVDPGSGNVVSSMFAGSEPGQIVLSNDASMLFTISGAAPLISRYDLNAGAKVGEFTVVDNMFWTPVSIAPLADSATAVAVARTPPGYSYNFPTGISYASSVVIYDNGVPRPNSIVNFAPGDFAGNINQAITAIYPAEGPDLFYGIDNAGEYGNGTRNFFSLLADNGGVHVQRQLNPIPLSDTPSVPVALDGGKLYTSSGKSLLPDASQIQGSYAASGTPIPFTDRNRVIYFYPAGPYSSSSLTEFELDSMRPLASLAFPPSGFNPGPQAAVRAGPTTIAVAINGQILLIPLSAMTPWQGSSTTLQTVAPGVSRMNLTVNDMAVVPGTAQLVFTTPSKAGPLGNSIVTFDPAGSQVVSAVFAGSEPGRLAITPDGASVYTICSGESHITRVNLAAGVRDLVFSADPFGKGGQYTPDDMVALGDGAVAMSFNGIIAVFDDGTPRPQVDFDTQGEYAFLGGTTLLATNDARNMIYAYDATWSTGDSKRLAETPQGVQWLSSSAGLPLAPASSSGNLLYTSYGYVIDPERSRVVGKLNPPNSFGVAVAVDAAAGHVFFASAATVSMYDIGSYALLGSTNLPGASTISSTAIAIARFGPDGLAVATSAGQVFIVSISSIPLLASPTPPPAQPGLPSTPGVTVIDLAASDLAYDSSRNLIYATTPNSEAANGDRIVSIDPGSGSVVGSWPGGLNPRLLSLSSDSTQLYFTSGSVPVYAYNGLSLSSETITPLDPATGNTGAPFPQANPGTGADYTIADFSVLPGSPQSVAVLESLYQEATLDDGSTALNRVGVYLGAYDSGVARVKTLGSQVTCSSISPGATASQLYCSSGPSLYRVSLDANGAELIDSFALLPGLGSFGHMVFNGTWLFTSTGLVVDPVAKRTVTRVSNAQGPVAVSGNTVWWLDLSAFYNSPSVALRSYDATTFQSLGVRQIKVTSNNASRLIACGQGRVAFASGNQIFIVNPTL